MRPQDVRLPPQLAERLARRAPELLRLGALADDSREASRAEEDALAELARRLDNTYPYPDAHYVGQMGKYLQVHRMEIDFDGIVRHRGLLCVSLHVETIDGGESNDARSSRQARGGQRAGGTRRMNASKRGSPRKLSKRGSPLAQRTFGSRPSNAFPSHSKALS